MTDVTTRLSSQECWGLLRRHELGRLAFHLAGEVHITPVNYAVDGETILFRTAEGNKLLGVVMDSDVAFEIDGIGAHEAWSVVVRGSARVLEGQEAYRAESIPLRPWVGSDKHTVVEISADEVTGRRFALDKPREHIGRG